MFKDLNLRKSERWFNRLIFKIPFFIFVFTELVLLYDFGFKHPNKLDLEFELLYRISLLVGVFSVIIKYFKKPWPPLKSRPVDLLLVVLLVALIFTYFNWFHLPFLAEQEWIQIAIFILLVREYSFLNFELKKPIFRPSQLFILSFVSIILLGTLLLQLPNATTTEISFIDALFTSTSAVCVTGLAVVDTGTFFSHFGQSIILILIQIGGLGIMTFTSYFGYFFKGSSSLQSQVFLRDMTNSEKLSEVFGILKKIIIITFFIEFIGALFIYLSVNKSLFNSFGNQLFFSLFHSVSAFCNAGFSTLTNGLNQPGFNFNYNLQLTISFLIILGGIGYPIIFNGSKYFKHLLFNRLKWFNKHQKSKHIPWVININTRIVLVTTLVLLIGGTLLIFIFEFNHSLKDHSLYGKIVGAFFGSVTPRTAGFNTVDLTTLAFPTVLITFLLMWIGASPASTGGGIKTSTFAVALLNVISIARGKNKIEVFRREISELSVRRAFSIITLSLITIGMAILFVSVFDPEKDILAIVFECFSAYSTVGLSLGITSSLSSASKLVLIITMLIGRVSMLTVLIAIFKQFKQYRYSYPSEEILIN